jgi:hypothetical protein
VSNNVKDDTVITVQQNTYYWFVNVRPTGLFSEKVNGNRYALSSCKNYNQLYGNNFRKAAFNEDAAAQNQTVCSKGPS